MRYHPVRHTPAQEYGETLEGAAEAIWQFNKGIVDATYDLIPAVKPQIAMYEQFVFLILSTNLLIILSSSLCVFYYTDRYCDY